MLRELDLIQSGLSDKTRLPQTLPSRKASFLLRGEVDERQTDDLYTVIVRAELVSAETAQAVDTFEFECVPKELEAKLAVAVDRLSERLALPGENAQPAPPTGNLEAQSLEDLATRDLRCFRRKSPIDFSDREFHLPGELANRGVPRLINPDTPLGRHVLHKSIDRLESILLLNPDDATAAYALGFCYSLHEKETYRPDRADELLRKAYSLGPSSELAALALSFLAEIAFHDRTGQLDSAPEEDAAKRIWFAFEQMPAAHRDYRWPRLLKLLGPLCRQPGAIRNWLTWL